ncbi:MAG: hypothetical protein ACRDRJ_12125 [Streptosporangiaceae bacterium]
MALFVQTPLGATLIAVIVAALLTVGGSPATAYLEELLHLMPPR